MELFLTPREKEVAVCLMEGHSNREIAEILSISVHTVKAHIESIYNKFNVTNRVMAVIAIIKSGLVEIPMNIAS